MIDPVEDVPVPNFEACGNCGADAQLHVFWDNATGWTCSACGAADGDE